MTVKFHNDGTWSYDQTTTMIIPNYDAPFEHRDRNRLTKIADPKLNPTAAAKQEVNNETYPLLCSRLP